MKKIPELQALMTGLVLGESPRWHDDRLWFSDWGAQEVIAVDLAGKSEVIVRVPSLPFCIDWLPDGRLLIVSGRNGLLLRRELDGPPVLGDHHHAWGKKRRRAQEVQHPVIFLPRRIRRVDEDEIEGFFTWPMFSRELREPTERILGETLDPRAHAKRFQIAPDQRSRRLMILNEDGLGGAAAHSFDPDRAGSGKHIEEARSRHSRTQHIEQRLAQAIARRTKRQTLQALQDAAAVGTCDDAHRISRIRSADLRKVIAPLPLTRQSAQNTIQVGSLRRIIGKRERFVARQLQYFAIAQRVGNLKT